MTCLNVLEGEIWKREKSWKSERSNQNIVMNEEHRDECRNSSEGCDGRIHVQNWWMQQFTAQQPKFTERNLSMRLSRGCRSEFQTEIHPL